jgi:hypothetical protein
MFAEGSFAKKIVVIKTVEKVILFSTVSIKKALFGLEF